MKKVKSGFLSAPLITYLFYLFSSYSFVLGLTEYFFDDEIWGNQSIFNCFLLISVFFLLKYTFPLADKRTLRYGTLFSGLLSLSLVMGNCIYWGGSILALFASAKISIITLLTIWGFTAVILAVFIMILKGLEHIPSIDNQPWKIYRHPWIYGILMFFCWLPCYLAYYPGIFAYDIEVQTMEALGITAYSRFHPPLHTFIWDIALSLGSTLGVQALVLYSLFQMGLFAIAFTYVLHFMIKRKYNNWLILGSFLFFACNPVIALFSFIPVKDAMLAVCFVFFTVELCTFIDDKEAYAKSIPANIRLILWGILCCLLRNNVIYALVPVFICMLFLLRKYWKKVLLWFACVLLGYLLINGPLYSALGIQKGNSREMLSVPMQQIAYVVVYNEASLTADELTQINEYIPTENLASIYNPRFADPVKNTFITENFNNNPVAFVQLWFRLFTQYPEDYAVAFLNLHIPYWYPDANSVDMFSKRAYIETTVPDMPQTDYVVIRDSKIPSFYEQYEKIASFKRFETLPVISNLFSLSLPVWLLLSGITILLIRKNKDAIVPFLPAVFLWATFLLGPVSNLRYLLPIIVLYPIYVGLILQRK